MKLLKEECHLDADVTNFLHENKELIISNSFDKLYETTIPFDIHVDPNQLTRLFLAADINPLFYMSKVFPTMFEKLDIESINIPNNIESIGFNAFSDCYKLKSVNMSDNIKWIEMDAFSGCISLNKINISRSLNYLPGCCFAGCRSLLEITIPKTLKELAHDALYEDTKIIYEGSEEQWNKIQGSDYYKNYEIEFLNK